MKRDKTKDDYAATLLSEKTYVAGLAEIVEHGDGSSKTINYISSPEGLVAVEISQSTGSKEWYWVFTDHLGSITSLVRESDGQKFEMSFDAWGNRRDPATWVNYTTTLPDFIIDRGFTGHEHYNEFGLINMNGRVYDPVIARFLSPDSYIQAPGLAQNYNGYMYCLSNPLKFVDPNGEFFVFDSWIVGLFSGGWKEANKRAGNDLKIWGGLFVTDPNKSFGGKIWEIFSRFTWQLPQTIGGWGTAQTYNTFGFGGGVEKVEYKYGATVVKTQNDWSAVTQGSYIVGGSSLSADENNPLFQHEYGHYIQSQKMGLAYYPRVGIPSLLSKGVHDFNPVEQDANRRAFLYFNKEIDGFMNDSDLWNFSFKDNKGWDFYRNPLNIDGSNTRLQYVNYQNKDDIKSLDKIKIQAKWYDHASWLLFGGPIWIGLINADYYNN